MMTRCSQRYFMTFFCADSSHRPLSSLFTPYIMSLGWKQKRKSAHSWTFFSPANRMHCLCVSAVHGSSPGVQPLQDVFRMSGCQGPILWMVFAGKQVSILSVHLRHLLCPALVYLHSFVSLRARAQSLGACDGTVSSSQVKSSVSS